ncbi:oligopeptidase B [Vibrio nigripulchritudo]|nr:oligopeptidase B [Vibrio nigripulchritudo]BDU34618.1 oligopeptidase B [Vibrio nigripulchritudo]
MAQDEFDWLRDDARSNGEVKQFLSERDNATTEYLKRNEILKQALLDEWQNDNVVKADSPWLLMQGVYYKLGIKNGQRAILMKSTQSASEEVLLDLSSRQQDHDYYHLAAWRLSSDGAKIALAEDITGTGEHRISVVDLETGSESLVADGTESTILWSSDSQSIFVIKQELPTLRPYKLVQIDLKTKKQTPVFTESDSAWLVSAYLASDSRWAVIQSNNESSVEQVLLNLKTGALSKTLLPRKDGKEYFADVADDQLFLNSNHNNGFAIWKKSLRSEAGEFQLIFRPESGEVIDNFYLFESALVVATLRGQDKYLTAVRNGKTLWKKSLSEDGVVTWVKRNGDFSSNRIRLRSMSLVQPPKWSELDVESGTVSDLSSDFYPEHHPQKYVSKQIWVEKGSIRVPVTLAYRKDTLTENSPVILYGYGAYGVTMRPYFMPQILSVLNQGAIYAIAHVRGGGFLGSDWHVSGRGINKQNGIDDFHVASQFMKTFQSGQRPVLAIGGSAGGTLVAAAINQKPELYQGAVLQVPFLDVVNSMSDSTLPLSDQQYLEWGNPNDAQEQRVMLEFDPYQNLKKQSYPPVLVRIGYQDRRVPFWEGAKYIARMQKLSTADNPYLLRTDFVSGHRPDRRHALNFQAEEYAFLLSLVQHSSAE